MTLKLSRPMQSSNQNNLKTYEVVDCDSEDVFIISAPPWVLAINTQKKKKKKK